MNGLSNKLKTRRRTGTYLDEITTTVDTIPANPTDYVLNLRRVLSRAAKAGIQRFLIVLYCRVSSGKQGRNGNLDHQWPYVRRRVKKLSIRYGVNVKVIGEFDEEVSATKLLPGERPELAKAARLAKKHDAILVALNTSKFVRNEHYWPQRKALPTVEDFERLRSLVGDVRLATIINPNHQEDKGGDTARGIKASDAKSGRPLGKKKRRMKLKLQVIRLVKEGCGNREIGRRLEVHEATVRRWKIRYTKYLGGNFGVRHFSADQIEKHAD